MAIEHLRRDDVPETLALLRVLFGNRATLPEGYTPDETGADIAWKVQLSGRSLVGSTNGPTLRDLPRLGRL